MSYETLIGRTSVLDPSCEDITFHKVMEELSLVRYEILDLIEEYRTLSTKVEPHNENKKKTMDAMAEQERLKATEIDGKVRDAQKDLLNIDLTANYNRVKELEDSLRMMRDVHEEELSEITIESVKEELKELQEEVEHLRDFISSIQEHLTARLGQSTLDNINMRIDAISPDELSEEDKEDVLFEAEQSMDLISNRLTVSKFNVYKTVDTVVDTIATPLTARLGDNANIGFAGVIVLAIVAMAFFPVLQLIVAVPIIYLAFTFLRTYVDNKYIVSLYIPIRQVAMIANEKEDVINSKAKELLDEKVKSVKELYEEAVAIEKEAIAKEEEAIRKAKESALDGFDEEALRQSLTAQYDTKIANYKQLIIDTQKTIQKIDDRMNEIRDTLVMLKTNQEKLKELFVKYSMSSEAGSSRYINEYFYVRDKGTSIEWFEWEKQANIIIYTEDMEDKMPDFFKLITTQIMQYMVLDSLKIYLVDVKTKGSNYSEILLPGVVEVLDSTQSIGEAIDNLDKTHSKILGKVGEQLSDIHIYNKRKIENASNPEPYNLMFFDNYPPQSVGSEKFLQLVRNSKRVGIIPIILIKKEVLTGIMEKNSKVYDEAHLSLFESIENDGLWLFEKDAFKPMKTLTGEKDAQGQDEYHYVAQQIKEQIKLIRGGD